MAHCKMELINLTALLDQVTRGNKNPLLAGLNIEECRSRRAQLLSSRIDLVLRVPESMPPEIADLLMSAGWSGWGWSDPRKAAPSTAPSMADVVDELPRRLAFGAALDVLQKGGRVAREGWDAGRYLMRVSHVIADVHPHDVATWLPVQDEILASDWMVML